MKNFLNSKNILYIIIGLLLLIVVWVWSIFWYRAYHDAQSKERLLEFNSVVGSQEYTRENCEFIFDFNKKYLETSNNIYKYNTFQKYCTKNFDITKQGLELEFCSSVIKWTKKDFKEEYIKLDSFSEVQGKCSSKFLSVTFSTWSLFDAENNFKSSIELDFSLPFYEDTAEPGTKEFIENRKQAKEKLVGLIEISPQVDITDKDIVLYQKKAILYLDLEPTTKYDFNIKGFSSGIEWVDTKAQEFSFQTPENKYFGIISRQKASLFEDTRPPELELVSYDSWKTSTNVKICRIDNETYAKIEVLQSSDDFPNIKKDFFRTGMDQLWVYDCKTKQIDIPPSDKLLQRITFSFDDIIGNPARSGLYFVTFEDTEQRYFNQRLQEPIFFGIIDSHITMKVSKNGEAFFFVNDFEWKPLAKQNIRAYVNTYKSHESKYNNSSRKYDKIHFSPLETSIFGTWVILWQTWADWVLKVNLKGKIDEVFEKTFSDTWSYEYSGNHNSFFITSASDTHLTYVSSKWNGGIWAWNFGYSMWGGWWYGPRNENADEITLSRWDREEPSLYSHLYTDRVLYLPWEDVNIKAILRNSRDLSIPESKQINIKIQDPKWDEMVNKNLTISEFWSITDTFNLWSSALLGNYRIMLLVWDEQIGYWGFSVEIFKNPKFKNEVMLGVEGLDNELVIISKTDIENTTWWYQRKTYNWDFTIKASVSSQYYSWAPVKSAQYSYKIYKQYHYDSDYWSDCYYGCYWEPQKEFYSEWKWTLDENGFANFSVPVEFTSRYSDYKYVAEITVTDSIWDQISGSNSVIARLPSQYKSWDPNSGIYFKSDSRFYKSGTQITLEGWLSVGKFSTDYNDKFLLLIKKKNYITHFVDDVRWYSRPVTKIEEKIEKILEVNDTNFTLWSDGKLRFNHILSETWEYVFEFGKINSKIPFDTIWLLDGFRQDSDHVFRKEATLTIDSKWLTSLDDLYDFMRYCDTDKHDCDTQKFRRTLKCDRLYTGEVCIRNASEVTVPQKIKVSDLIDSNSKKYFSVISYGDKDAENPIQSDNKITVLSEKVSYKIWETAKILVRLPFSSGKILWTVEKQWVISHEYIDVPWNTFFKEIVVDDSFLPNAYIWVVVVDTDNQSVPEYKVGYSEIVVDKSDKKTDITISPNKKKYEPRETVILDISVKDNKKRGKKSELTVMVVDDSLISLMGNIDPNSLEKFYKKLPFQIQTSLTNIAMLKNYYFSRQGIVGWSGFGSFKWGDSAVSSRNVFKNTAYYNASVVTDNYWNAQVSFNLPDNLTNFRVMVISNSKDNFFGYNEDFIEVRKDVIVEDRTPLILREGDTIELGANIFNTTDEPIGFKTIFAIDGIWIENPEKLITIAGWESGIVTWKVKNPRSCGELDQQCEIPYIISVLWDSVKHSDKVEWMIEIKPVPSLVQHRFISKVLWANQSWDFTLPVSKNTDIDKSLYTLHLSNNPLAGIEKIVKSLAKYPYGCWEQLLSSTMPNAILQKFTNILGDSWIKQSTIDKNLAYGLEKIYDTVLPSGLVAYWQWDRVWNVHITAYAIRVLLEIQSAGVAIDSNILKSTVDTLKASYTKLEGFEKAESLWSLAAYYKGDTHSALGISDLTLWYNTSSMERHGLIAYTYALVLADSVKYSSIIDTNIILIQDQIKNGTDGSYYYNRLSDKGEFTQMLLDYKYDKALVWTYINEMSQIDWSSYWYSTKSKNNAFAAFIKYIEIYGKDSVNTLTINLNDSSSNISLWKDKNIYKSEIELTKVLQGDKVSLNVENISGGPLFVTASMRSYPKDPIKVPSFSNKVSLERIIYEVVDESNMTPKCRWNNWDKSCTQAAGLLVHTWDSFKKWVTYKIELKAKFEKNTRRENLTMEDFIPAGFRILNSKFKTNTTATKQATTEQNSWRWEHIENRPGVVMAHSKNSWGKTSTYEYFVTADFAWDFIYPPAVVYLMYQPETRANTGFRRVVIK